MRFPRLSAAALAFALFASACTGSSSSPIVTGTSPDGSIIVGDTAPPGAPPATPACPADAPVVRNDSDNPGIEFFDEGPGLASVHISQAAFDCATDVVIVGDSDLNRVAIAAALAGSIDAPLLVSSATATGLLGFETERLAPEQIITVGDDLQFDAPSWSEVMTLQGDTAGLAAQINQLAGFDSTLPLPADVGPDTLVTLANALETGAGLTVPTPAASSSSSTTPPAAPAQARFDVPSLTVGTGDTGVALLIDGNNAAAAMAGFATAHASGAMATLVDGSDLRAVPGAGRALNAMGAPAGSIQVFGTLTTDSHWQLDVLRNAQELPGGGYLVLPRLLVALYGNPQTTALGALGEQGPSEAVTRVREIASGFSGSEAPLLPAFEIITTVAHASAGGDGDYSNEMPNSVIQPWIDEAAAQDVYVILDLQSGRDDFLSQAMEYEQELLNPHVGLALDPEWRLAPDEVHLQQVGSVQASEVNQVIDWLADLVREHDLPQKVLLLHQFREFMLQDRETIEPRPELQVIIQMDGQGAVPDKYATWDFLTFGWEDHPWRWGWKNFYDEDVPGGGLTPAQIFQLEPDVVYVSYQ